MRLISLILLFALGIPSVVSSAQSEWVKGKSDNSTVRLISEFSSIDPSTREIKLALEFKLKKGWHVYWKNPGDIGYAPKLKWNLPSSWNAGELLYPLPKRIKSTDANLSYTSFGYEGEVAYPVKLNGNGAEESIFPINLGIDYLVCEVQCIPESVELNLELPVSSEKLSSHHTKIENAFKLLPKSATDQVATQFISETEVILEFQEPVVDLFIMSKRKCEVEKLTPLTWRVIANEPIKPFEWTAALLRVEGTTGIYGKVEKNPFSAMTSPLTELLWALLFAFLGGLILNVMPCVLPVLVLKSVSLLKVSKKKHHLRRSIFLTILGILTSFLFLGALISTLKTFGHEVGWGFQFQNPSFVSFMILVIFIFALNLFGIFEINLSPKTATRMTHYKGHFFEGVFATLLSTPCSAPLLGTALAYALSQPLFTILLLFLTIGIGLAFPYIVLLVAPGALKHFPKPGDWMLKVKSLMGYSLLLAALWLIYVLFQQTEAYFIFGLFIAMAALLFLIREFKFSIKWLFVFIISAACVYYAGQSERGRGPTSSLGETRFSVEQVDERIEKGETLFIVVTADWCITCKFNEKTVIETEWFQEKLRTRNVGFVIADWTKRDEAIGHFLKKYGRVGIPFGLLVNKDKYSVFPELLTRTNVEDHWNSFFSD